MPFYQIVSARQVYVLLLRNYSALQASASIKRFTHSFCSQYMASHACYQICTARQVYVLLLRNYSALQASASIKDSLNHSARNIWQAMLATKSALLRPNHHWGCVKSHFLCYKSTPRARMASLQNNFLDFLGLFAQPLACQAPSQKLLGARPRLH